MNILSAFLQEVSCSEHSFGVIMPLRRSGLFARYNERQSNDQRYERNRSNKVMRQWSTGSYKDRLWALKTWRKKRLQRNIENTESAHRVGWFLFLVCLRWASISYDVEKKSGFQITLFSYFVRSAGLDWNRRVNSNTKQRVGTLRAWISDHKRIPALAATIRNMGICFGARSHDGTGRMGIMGSS